MDLRPASADLVLAGQPVAVMGHTGEVASLGHGHIEIGFSDGSGDPLNHHGAIAWTSSGDAMRHVLVARSRAFRIKTSWVGAPRRNRGPTRAAVLRARRSARLRDRC
jgi:hypothetical protein